jgi:hypothetical protein
MIRHTGGKPVTATTRGLIAVGATKSEALEKLAKLVKTAEREVREQTVQTHRLSVLGM